MSPTTPRRAAVSKASTSTSSTVKPSAVRQPGTPTANTRATHTSRSRPTVPVVEEIDELPTTTTSTPLTPHAVVPLPSNASVMNVRDAHLVPPTAEKGPRRELRVDERTNAKAFRQWDDAGNTMYGYSYNSSEDPSFQQQHGNNVQVQSRCMVYTSSSNGPSSSSPLLRRSQRSSHPHHHTRRPSNGAPTVEEPNSEDDSPTDQSAAQRHEMIANPPRRRERDSGDVWGGADPTSRMMQRMMQSDGMMFGGMNDEFFGPHGMMSMMQGMGMMGMGMRGEGARRWGGGGRTRGFDSFFDNDDFFFGSGPVMGGRW